LCPLFCHSGYPFPREIVVRFSGNIVRVKKLKETLHPRENNLPVGTKDFCDEKPRQGQTGLTTVEFRLPVDRRRSRLGSMAGVNVKTASADLPLPCIGFKRGVETGNETKTEWNHIERCAASRHHDGSSLLGKRCLRLVKEYRPLELLEPY